MIAKVFGIILLTISGLMISTLFFPSMDRAASKLRIQATCKWESEQDCEAIFNAYGSRGGELGTFAGETACGRGIAIVCQQMALYFKKIKLPDESLSYSKRACDLGLRDSCGDYGIKLYDQGERAVSINYIQQSCGQGDARSCFAWGLAGEDLKDPDMAYKGFYPGCYVHGLARACYKLGLIFITKGQLPYARSVLDKSCLLNIKEACSRLATLRLPTPAQRTETLVEWAKDFRAQIKIQNAYWEDAKSRRLTPSLVADQCRKFQIDLASLKRRFGLLKTDPVDSQGAQLFSRELELWIESNSIEISLMINGSRTLFAQLDAKINQAKLNGKEADLFLARRAPSSQTKY